MFSSEKIILRPLENADASALAELANNKKIWINLRDILPHPYTTDDAVFFINLTKKENPHLNFAINYAGQFCGMVGLTPQQDIYRLTAVIGYWIGEPFWNKGIATKAVEMSTGYGFNDLGFIRIHTGIFEHNIGSMKVLEKNGYKKDCVFEKSVIKDGKILDEHRYSKIKPGL
ncbi:MAG: GNAT family N-acetyltransferase [Bacteroidota bacterium]|nr:GNAT family N-acetyltransferase [Bacteroidota bacterium]